MQFVLTVRLQILQCAFPASNGCEVTHASLRRTFVICQMGTQQLFLKYHMPHTHQNTRKIKEKNKCDSFLSSFFDYISSLEKRSGFICYNY